MTNEEIKWIGTICDPLRWTTAQPWTVEVGGETWTLATNGHLLAATRGDFGYARPEEPKFQKVLTLPACAPTAFPMATVRALLPLPVQRPQLPDCDKCDNEGKIDCEECGGTGYVNCTCPECSDEHERDCRECSGDGHLPCDCGRAPVVHPKMETVFIGKALFNLALFARVLPHLPDAPATWRQDKDDSQAVMETGEWRIVLMPLRPGSCEPDHVITLNHEQAA